MAWDSDSTVIVVFVSVGGFCFLAFVLFALCCFIKYRKKASQEQEADNVRVDEHVKIKEDIVEGPHGTKAVVLTIEDDVHIQEDIRKNEKFGGGMHAKSAVGINAAESSSRSGH